jgi:hypothetical protein
VEPGNRHPPSRISIAGASRTTAAFFPIDCLALAVEFDAKDARIAREDRLRIAVEAALTARSGERLLSDDDQNRGTSPTEKRAESRTISTNASARRWSVVCVSSTELRFSDVPSRDVGSAEASH